METTHIIYEIDESATDDLISSPALPSINQNVVPTVNQFCVSYSINVCVTYAMHPIQDNFHYYEKAIWQPRESIGGAIFKDGYSYSYDISVPLRSFYKLVEATKQQLDSLPAKVFGFGHIGDSNLHLVVRCNEFNPMVYQRLEPFVYEQTSKLCGSISSEHGIGFLKTKYLKFSKHTECVNAMKGIKSSMDPNGILNPYKVLP